MSVLKTTSSKAKWDLRRFKVFAHLSGEEQEGVARVLQLKECKKGDPIFLSEQDAPHVFFLFRGLVKIVRTDPRSGREIILYLIKPGDLFGVLMYADKPYTGTSAVALQRSLVGHLNVNDFNRLAGHEKFRLELNKLVAARMSQIENRLEELMFRNVPCRLARALLWLCNDFPEKSDDRCEIDVDLTQRDLAGLVGASREVTSLTLNDFKRKGWVKTSGRRVHLLDQSALQSLAE